MKCINNYLIEKLKIHKNIKVLDDERPNDVDIDKFNDWLENEFDFTKFETNALKDHINKDFQFYEEEYTISDKSLFIKNNDRYYDTILKKCINKFPNLPDDSYKAFTIESQKNNNKITGVLCKGEWMLYSIIFISNKDKLLYTYILNIKLD